MLALIALAAQAVSDSMIDSALKGGICAAFIGVVIVVAKALAKSSKKKG